MLIFVLWFSSRRKKVRRQCPGTRGPFPALDLLWCFHPGLGREKISKLSQERGRNARRSPFKSTIEANNYHMLFWSASPGKSRKRRKRKKKETIYPNFQQVVSHDVPNASKGIKRGGCFQTSQDVFYSWNSSTQFFTLMRLVQPTRLSVKPRFQHRAEAFPKTARKLLASILDLKSASDQSGLFLALQAPS